MGLKKYQKEYEKYCKYSRKGYNTIKRLYDSVNNDKKLREKKDMNNTLETLKDFLSTYTDIVNDLSFIDFTKVKDIVNKKTNNLIVLPLYPDEDIYINSNESISDIFDYPQK